GLTLRPSNNWTLSHSYYPLAQSHDSYVEYNNDKGTLNIGAGTIITDGDIYEAYVQGRYKRLNLSGRYNPDSYTLSASYGIPISSIESLWKKTPSNTPTTTSLTDSYLTNDMTNITPTTVAYEGRTWTVVANETIAIMNAKNNAKGKSGMVGTNYSNNNNQVFSRDEIDDNVRRLLNDEWPVANPQKRQGFWNFVNADYDDMDDGESFIMIQLPNGEYVYPQEVWDFLYSLVINYIGTGKQWATVDAFLEDINTLFAFVKADQQDGYHATRVLYDLPVTYLGDRANRIDTSFVWG
ncbi:MAG TPA: hypothetical protein PKH98_06730, partial [Candidatus Omnitrophota bacterium]|nr:hypothetical protein [Candidatus Omnitrophota bacterium]